MAKPEWGVKRTCDSCGARFYDLGRTPVVCPKCGAEQNLSDGSRTKRSKPEKAAPAAAPAPTPEPAAELIEEDEELLGDDSAAIEQDDTVADDDDSEVAAEKDPPLDDDDSDEIGTFEADPLLEADAESEDDSDIGEIKQIGDNDEQR